MAEPIDNSAPIAGDISIGFDSEGKQWFLRADGTAYAASFGQSAPSARGQKIYDLLWQGYPLNDVLSANEADVAASTDEFPGSDPGWEPDPFAAETSRVIGAAAYEVADFPNLPLGEVRLNVGTSIGVGPLSPIVMGMSRAPTSGGGDSLPVVRFDGIRSGSSGRTNLT